MQDLPVEVTTLYETDVSNHEKSWQMKSRAPILGGKTHCKDIHCLPIISIFSVILTLILDGLHLRFISHAATGPGSSSPAGEFRPSRLRCVQSARQNPCIHIPMRQYPPPMRSRTPCDTSEPPSFVSTPWPLRHHYFHV